MTRPLLALALAALPALAMAQAAAPERRVVDQKESLVRRLVFDSPAEARIAASGNAEARAQFDRARALHARAKALADSGDLREAESELNEAMWAIGKARQLVPDTMARVVELRVRYASLSRTVDTLMASYERHLARGRGKDAGGVPTDETLVRARALAEEARSYANSEHVALAATAMEKAERELMAGLNRVLGSATIDYSQRFETQAEEFAWELERNRAFRDLVPIALAELKPRPEAVNLVERFMASNAKHVDTAQSQAGAKHYRQAIDTIRTGTTYLQAALSAAGLVMPKEAAAN